MKKNQFQYNCDHSIKDNDGNMLFASINCNVRNTVKKSKVGGASINNDEPEESQSQKDIIITDNLYTI